MVQLDMDMKTANEELDVVLARVGIVSTDAHPHRFALKIRDGDTVLGILSKYVTMYRSPYANGSVRREHDIARADAMQKVIDEQGDNIRNLMTLSGGIILAHWILDCAERDGAQVEGTVSSIAIILGYLS